MTEPLRQIHLAAHFPGVNNTTVWSDPAAGSHIEFSSFVKLAQTAERAKFDFFFLAEGLRLREQRGNIHDLDVVGRPDTFTVLSALAAVTRHIGLSGTINSTFNEPFEVARQFASLDHLSGGRAAWNVVTSWDAFTGENFRRAASWPGRTATAGPRSSSNGEGALGLLGRRRHRRRQGDRAVLVLDPGEGDFDHHGEQFDIEGRFGVPRSPQGHPVIFQAGDSDTGESSPRPTRLHLLPARHHRGRAAFYEDVKGRLTLRAIARRAQDPSRRHLRSGQSEEDAEERSAVIRRQQVSGPTALFFLEQVWNRDLSAYDPDGPLPDIDPDLGEPSVVQGRVMLRRQGDRDPVAGSPRPSTCPSAS